MTVEWGSGVGKSKLYEIKFIIKVVLDLTEVETVQD
uniref:Uncharacterized protein n=1 Tax=Rhizophora mucronata TaxID=61149 RepID=A0A2P2R316_RHIMU